MFRIEIDSAAVASKLKAMPEQIEPLLKKGASALAAQTHAHVISQVQEKLHSTREKYLGALHFAEVNDHTWLISLDREAFWIEDGIEPNTSMVDDLLKARPGKGPVKTAKDGCVLNARNKVLTNTGWKKIKDIVAGDLVLTHSGKFREVKELLVQKAGVGTEYVTISPGVVHKTPTVSKENNDLTCPSFSVTADHRILTKRGWIAASELTKDDLLAAPADLKRLCESCSAPLPINTPTTRYCLNNKCARQAACKEGRGFNFSKKQRKENGAAANKKAKEMGVYDSPTWGTRDPETLKKLRDASAAAMRKAISKSGSWKPEVFFEKCLAKAGILFEREVPIVTDRVVNAGRGRTRNSVLFIDFMIPSLKLAIELDGAMWHSDPKAQERDMAKDRACARDGIKIMRIPSHKIYKLGDRLASYLKLWGKNHSGELGIAWVKVSRIKKGVVNRPDHAFAKKYDICLADEEHSFCCEGVFIHNSRYRVIPFQHNKAPTRTWQPAMALQDTIKKELKQRSIPYGKIETDGSGNAKVGLLHKFDIMNKPVKTHNGPGQGWGLPNEVRKGPTGIPFLQGVRIYQNAVKDKNGNQVMDKFGKPKVSRQIMTFRIVSSKHKGTGRWVHPGLQARKFLDEAFIWAKDTWEKDVLPEIQREFEGN